MEHHDSVTVSPVGIQLNHSIRLQAEQACIADGATLNEFVNVAVAEKLAHQKHVEWVRNRMEATPELIARARQLLRKPDSNAPDPGDELPKGYSMEKLT